MATQTRLAAGVEEWMDSRYVLVIKSKDLGCPRYTADGEGGAETKFSFLVYRAG